MLLMQREIANMLMCVALLINSNCKHAPMSCEQSAAGDKQHDVISDDNQESDE